MENTRPKPDNNLVWAILCTVLCCMPLGVVAIIYSTKVDSLYNCGDYDGAEDAAKKAKTFSLIGAGITAVGIAIYLFVTLILLIAA